MKLAECLTIMRRRWLLLSSILLLVTMVHLVWVSHGEERFVATTKVVIGAEPAIPAVAGELVVAPPPPAGATTFGARPVLRCAADLLLGSRDFESRVYTEERFSEPVIEGQRRIAARYEPEGESGVSALVDRLESSVRISRSPERQSVEISAETSSPDDALIFSWAVAEGAHQFHAERARERMASFASRLGDEIDIARSRIDSDRQSLIDAEAKAGIADVAEQERLLHESIARVEEQQTALEARVRQNDRIIERRLHEQSFGGRIDVGQEAQATSTPRLEQIRDRLFAAKLDLETKISTYSPKHHEVQKARSVIAGLEKSLAREQERVLGERYRQFSEETQGLIQENALHNLEREVLDERRTALEDSLLALASTRKTLQPMRDALVASEERLVVLLRAQEEQGARADLAAQGAVTVYDPAQEAIALRTGGLTLGTSLITLALAIFLAFGAVALVESFDRRVRSTQDLRRYLDLPILGSIPRASGGACLLTDAVSSDEISQRLDASAAMLDSASREIGMQTFVVTSALPGEGRTTLSIDLAVSLARRAGRVLLIDADLRNPRIHEELRVDNRVGFSGALDTRLTPEGVLGATTEAGGLDPSQCVQRTLIENLDVIPAGMAPADPVPLLESGRLHRLCAELRDQYDYVVMDSPPVNSYADALTLSGAVDGTILVVGADMADQQDVQWAKHLLVNVQANTLGVFLNDPSREARPVATPTAAAAPPAESAPQVVELTE